MTNGKFENNSTAFNHFGFIWRIRLHKHMYLISDMVIGRVGNNSISLALWLGGRPSVEWKYTHTHTGEQPHPAPKSAGPRHFIAYARCKIRTILRASVTPMKVFRVTITVSPTSPLPYPDSLMISLRHQEE